MRDHHSISRRGFASLALGAASLSLLPMAARAAGTIKALAVTCIDYRFLNKDAAFIANDLDLFKNADIVALAGASLAAVSTKLPESAKAFWEQLAIANQLHGFHDIVLIDHMDCGAYKAEFAPLDPAKEHEKHVQVLTTVSARLKGMGFTVNGYIMPKEIDGCAEHIIKAA
jgi:carbonic anhydrase